MRIAIASGKGGTGKTLISTSLTALWSREGYPVIYVDADAEEPNGHLFLKPNVVNEQRFSVWIPSDEKNRCVGHGKCQEICAFNAILSKKDGVLVFKSLCHSCGACILACPEKALCEQQREIGWVFVGQAGEAGFISGKLDVGEARVTPLIEKLICLVKDARETVIVDAPPGTSCSAMAAVRGADLLLLVTEPTPFGMHDLQIAVEMGKALDIPLAAIINRADLGDNKVKKFLQDQSIPIMAEIPFEREIAAAYANAQMSLNHCEPFRLKMEELSGRIIRMTGVKS